ncbi:gamma carbonic anhydrase family protein [Clostridium sp. DL1XJH146]
MIYKWKGIEPKVGEEVFIAKSADVIGKVVLKKNSSIWFNTVLRGDLNGIEVGNDSNVQDGTIIHTDSKYPVVIGKGVTIGHNCIIHGCSIGNSCIIGMGATILNGAKIGKNSIVGANSLVTQNKEFEDGVLILESPAKAIRKLTDEEIEGININAEHYVESGREYIENLKQMNNE